MKNKRFKPIGILLLICAALLLPALFSSCAENPEEDYVFAEFGDGYAITSVKGLRRDVDLPSVYNGRPVVAVANDAFVRNGTVRNLTIPNSIKNIGERAFAECADLKSVTFEGGGSCEIGEGAFTDCSDLSEITFNSSVHTIGARAFENCRKLGKVVLDKAVLYIGEDAFKNCEQIYIDAPEDSYAQTYARANHLNTSYIETDRPTYLLIVGAVVLGIGIAVFLRIHDRKKAVRLSSEAAELKNEQSVKAAEKPQENAEAEEKSKKEENKS